MAEPAPGVPLKRRAWTWGEGLSIPWGAKLAICLALDLFDFTLGRAALGVSMGAEGLTAALMIVLFGPIGALALWEVVDVSEQFDGFVPTNTLIALAARRRRR